jgi:hypothetical protein
MTSAEDCVQVSWPPTPEELRLQPLEGEARVTRPSSQPPGPKPTPTDAVIAPGLDLSAYTRRGPEAGVAAGGLWGRWYVSLTASGSRPGSGVRPRPLRLSACEPPVGLNSALETTPIRATVRVSGDPGAGWAATPGLLASMSLARGVNPHFSAICNGHFAAESASVVVGCTIPELGVESGGLRAMWDAEREPLWQAGVDEMRWIFSADGFRPADLWRQIDWTLTPAAETVTGEWTFWPWPYRFPESGSVTAAGLPSAEYHAYVADVTRLVTAYTQPFGSVPNSTGTDTTGTGVLGSIGDRLRGFVVLSNEIRNRINRDSNIIRGLHGIGQQPRYSIDYFGASPAYPQLGGTPGKLIYQGVGPNGEIVYTETKM